MLYKFCLNLFPVHEIQENLFSFLANAFPQAVDSVAALEESLGMDLDAEAVGDDENNLNTARWAVYFTLKISQPELILLCIW